MKRIALLALPLLLAGCAAKVISSSPRSVVITAPDAAVAESQSMADAECRKHGRFARLVRSPSPTSNQFVFDCVQ